MSTTYNEYLSQVIDIFKEAIVDLTNLKEHPQKYRQTDKMFELLSTTERVKSSLTILENLYKELS